MNFKTLIAHYDSLPKDQLIQKLVDKNALLLKQENETVSVDGVNGPEIVLGSMFNVSTNGNWPTIFDAPRQ